MWLQLVLARQRRGCPLSFVEIGEEAPRVYDALLREGVIVRPLTGFGAPGALRISVGSPEENAFFADALGRVLARA